MSVIWSGFRRLADFSGRDRRGRFWPYALVVAVLVYVGLMLAMIPTMATMFGEAARYAAENPDQTTVVAGPGYYSVQIHDPDAALMPDFAPFFWAVRVAVIVGPPGLWWRADGRRRRGGPSHAGVQQAGCQHRRAPAGTARGEGPAERNGRGVPDRGWTRILQVESRAAACASSDLWCHCLLATTPLAVNDAHCRCSLP